MSLRRRPDDDGLCVVPVQVDLAAVMCALVVCDTQWRDCSSAEDSGEEHLAAADYLRLDSMVCFPLRLCQPSSGVGLPCRQR